MTSTSRLSDDDLYLFNEGTHAHLADKLGAHLEERDGRTGTAFAVWAPNAERVVAVGDFNAWDRDAPALSPRGDSGIWEGFVPDVGHGTIYKFHVVGGGGGTRVDKADPFAFHAETPPKTGSIVWDLTYDWGDADWMRTRGERNALSAPIAIYEVHLGSWQRGQRDRPLTYVELGDRLAEHVTHMGFTHVEFLPVMEHPFYGSWGYQSTGYFAPTSRFGTPQDLMRLIDRLHRAGIGVILDWVPSHFATDEHGLARFDGTHLYEHADPRQGYHPDWGSYIFNYGRNEVRSFLLSSAMHWLSTYHVDGIRVDAVASMLYLDYSRTDGEWIPNERGGRENLQAISFLRQLNTAIYREHPDVQTFAEESTAWPMVSRPVEVGGLGFGYKWDMGWMNDTLRYLAEDPVHRGYHHDELTFRMIYAFNENFVLPLSHDEVVHEKGSLASRMPGDDWQRLANLRLLLAYQFAQPGKKLLFMGGEFGQWAEWRHDHSLDWHLLEHARHDGVLRCVADLGRLYRSERSLHELDVDPSGFEWVDAGDRAASVLSFLRKGATAHDRPILVVCNFTPVVREGYRLGVPRAGRWAEVCNTDAADYGGSGIGNLGGLEADEVPMHGRPWSIELTLPPLAAVFLRPEGEPPAPGAIPAYPEPTEPPHD